MPLRNGHISTGNSPGLSPDKPLHVHVTDNMIEYSDEKNSLVGDRRYLCFCTVPFNNIKTFSFDQMAHCSVITGV